MLISQNFKIPKKMEITALQHNDLIYYNFLKKERIDRELKEMQRLLEKKENPPSGSIMSQCNVNLRCERVHDGYCYYSCIIKVYYTSNGIAKIWYTKCSTSVFECFEIHKNLKKKILKHISRETYDISSCKVTIESIR